MNNVYPMDVVHLEFAVEEWLNSGTAEVTIDIDASIEGAEGLELRQTIKDSLAEIIPNVEWRFSRVNRSRDRTGRENWQIGAQARVEEELLNDLSGKCKKLGAVGLQFRVGYVDYSPTKEAIEELNRTLRSKINELVSDELGRLSAELPNRDWRVSSVQYGADMSFSNVRVGNVGLGSVPHAVMMATSVDSAAYNDDDGGDDAVGSGGFEISQKVTLSASVTISSTVVGFDKAV